MIVPVFLPHLGCGERCIYCNQAVITDIRSIAVKDSIEKSLCPIHSQVEVGLYGGDIFGLGLGELTRLFALFDPYRDRISNFRISTRPVPLEDEMIEILRENRVDVIELGSPSFNDRILKVINRRHTAKDLETAFFRLRNEGFKVALQVMVGLPEETMDDIKENVRHILQMMPHYVRIYPLVVLKETVLAKMYEKGQFIPIPFEEAVERAVYMYLNARQHGINVVKMGLTANEIIEERVIAGHYHPAFGYIVKAEAFYLAVTAVLRASSITGGSIRLILNNRDIPHLLGHKRSNMERLEKAGFSVTRETGAIEEGAFLISQEDRTVEGSIFDALTTGP
jgi:uncharacterized radical SAM superfamily protein